MDEMPKLDANTAGLFNDALAKSTRTKAPNDAKINSANPETPPIPRNDDFGIIATGNIYPNTPPPPQYRGNNQQDLSLMDRFSGSVYYVEFDNKTDQDTTRFQFIYDFLIGNYYKYIKAKKDKTTLPNAEGLRTVIDSRSYKNLALVSYRTNIAFRIGFEFELVREIARREGKNVPQNGKTFLKTFQSYLVAFRETTDATENIINATNYTETYINNLVATQISDILDSPNGFVNSLCEDLKPYATNIYARYDNFYAPSVTIQP
jgi:cobaltochelatase CobS